MPLVDLDDPEELRARWSALAAVAHATGFDRRWYADEHGWYHQDETGSDLRMARLDGGRAVLFGFHTQHTQTAEADLLAGAPPWIGQPEVKRRMAAGELGFVYGSFNGTWARASYPGDPWQPLDDGFLPIGEWITSDEEAAREMIEWAAEWADYLGGLDELLPVGVRLIRTTATTGITAEALLELFAALGIGPHSAQDPDLRAALSAAAEFDGNTISQPVPPPSGPSGRATAPVRPAGAAGLTTPAGADGPAGAATRGRYADPADPAVPAAPANFAGADDPAGPPTSGDAGAFAPAATYEPAEESDDEESFVVPPGISPFTGQPIGDDANLIIGGPDPYAGVNEPYASGSEPYTPEPPLTPEPPFRPNSPFAPDPQPHTPEPPSAPDPAPAPPYQPDDTPDAQDDYGVVAKKPRLFRRRKHEDPEPTPQPSSAPQPNSWSNAAPYTPQPTTDRPAQQPPADRPAESPHAAARSGESPYSPQPTADGSTDSPYAPQPGAGQPPATPPGPGQSTDQQYSDPPTPGQYAAQDHSNAPTPATGRPLPSAEPPRVGGPVDDGEDFYASLFADAPAAATYTPDVTRNTPADQPTWSADDATSEIAAVPDAPTPHDPDASTSHAADTAAAPPGTEAPASQGTDVFAPDGTGISPSHQTGPSASRDTEPSASRDTGVPASNDTDDTDDTAPHAAVSAFDGTGVSAPHETAVSAFDDIGVSAIRDAGMPAPDGTDPFASGDEVSAFDDTGVIAPITDADDDSLPDPHQDPLNTPPAPHSERLNRLSPASEEPQRPSGAPQTQRPPEAAQPLDPSQAHNLPDASGPGHLTGSTNAQRPTDVPEAAHPSDRPDPAPASATPETAYPSAVPESADPSDVPGAFQPSDEASADGASGVPETQRSFEASPAQQSQETRQAQQLSEVESPLQAPRTHYLLDAPQPQQPLDALGTPQALDATQTQQPYEATTTPGPLDAPQPPEYRTEPAGQFGGPPGPLDQGGGNSADRSPDRAATASEFENRREAGAEHEVAAEVEPEPAPAPAVAQREWIGGAWINGVWIEDVAAYLEAQNAAGPAKSTEAEASPTESLAIDEPLAEDPPTEERVLGVDEFEGSAEDPPTEELLLDVDGFDESLEGPRADERVLGADGFEGAEGDLRVDERVPGVDEFEGSPEDPPTEERVLGVDGFGEDPDQLQTNDRVLGASRMEFPAEGSLAEDQRFGVDAVGRGVDEPRTEEPVLEGGGFEQESAPEVSAAESAPGAEVGEEPAGDRQGVVPAEERLLGVPTEDQLLGVPLDDQLIGVPVEDRPVEEAERAGDGSVSGDREAVVEAQAEVEDEAPTAEIAAITEEELENEYYAGSSPFAPQTRDIPPNGFSSLEPLDDLDYRIGEEDFHDQILGDADWTADQLGEPQEPSGAEVTAQFEAIQDVDPEDPDALRAASEATNAASGGLPPGQASGSAEAATGSVAEAIGATAGLVGQSTEEANAGPLAAAEAAPADAEAQAQVEESVEPTVAERPEKLVVPDEGGGAVAIPGLGVVGGDGPRVEMVPGSIEEAMRAEIERPRPRPKKTAAFEALHDWCRARTNLVPSGFTIQVQVLDPSAPSYRFDLEPPEVDDPQYAAELLTELLGDLWAAESQGEQGGWLFARIDTAGRTLRIDRWYDSVPDWWDNPVESRLDVNGLVRRLNGRGPDWQPSYLEKLYTTAR